MEELEGRRLLSDLALVKHDRVMAEVFELELAEGRQRRASVIRFAENAEREHEHRELLRDRSVIARFIHVRDEVPILPRYRHCGECYSHERELGKQPPKSRTPRPA